MSELSSFHDVRFPLGVSFGATGGPERRNEIVSLTSGREKRNARFSQSRRHYDAGTGVRSLADLHDVLVFFEARRGSLHAFRFRDPFDMKSCRPEETVSAADQVLGTGDGVTDALCADQDLWRGRGRLSAADRQAGARDAAGGGGRRGEDVARRLELRLRDRRNRVRAGQRSRRRRSR